MKILTKNGVKFAVGIFWQIPDKGKRAINLPKLVTDTGYNMYCQIGMHKPSNKSFKLTYGFCNKDGLCGENKVSSLGKFIIETSKLTSEYANSIICYKFQDAGEFDDVGKPLPEDMFGYIVLLNGTICPDEGEYVAPLESVRQSIIDQAHSHPIDTLYLPTDVAVRFLNIYERLDNAIYDDELLIFILNSASKCELKELAEFINEMHIESEISNFLNELMHYLNYTLPDQSIIALETHMLIIRGIKQVIQHELFRSKLKNNTTIDSNMRYLISNVIQVQLSSDEIYWKNNKFKQNYNKSVMRTIFSRTSKKYIISIAMLVLVLFTYFMYDFVYCRKLTFTKPSKLKQVLPKAISLAPLQLITLCLGHGDRFFKDLNHWTLTGMKCNSLGVSYMFTSDVDTTLNAFIRLVGESVGTTFQINKGIYSRKFGIVPVIPQVGRFTKEQIVDNLQQSAIDNQFKLALPTAIKINGAWISRYVISSKLSPAYLFDHGALDGVRISEINMTFDKNAGTYYWIIEGGF